jgi:hexosaminidase
VSGSRQAPLAGAWRAAVFLSLALAAGAAGSAAPPVPLIPLPASVSAASGSFLLDSSTRISVPHGDPGARAAAVYLAAALARLRGAAPRITDSAAGARPIRFERRAGLPTEGYALEITPAQVRVAASTDAGLFYGAVTLWQLVPAGAGAVGITALRIEDAPRYHWRGLMLDSARHYQTPDFIRRLLDGMALHKLNVLHWHLTDDQGWRLEIRRYPRLTEVGAYRVPAGRAAAADVDPATGQPRRYGGYYSQTTVRALIAYARARQIMVVPEIEMPGHAAAAIAAYPELGVAPVRLEAVPADWGIYPYLYNVEESTCRFLENVLDEVVALFPGPYVHVGGDEVVTGEWLDSPAAAARARALGLAGPAQLHAYLVQRMGRYLAARGRRLVGWDEIIEPGLASDATIVSWRGVDGALAAARRGNDTVLSPWPTLYLDFRQSDAADEPPGRLRLATLATVYRYEPMPPGLDAESARHVLGLQANVWTEHIATEERFAHAAFPRAAALAEVGWSPAASRNWPGFLARLAATFGRYRLLGLEAADSEFAVRAKPSEARRDAARIELATASGAGEIHYTLDASAPSAASSAYQGPLELSLPATLAALSTQAGEPLAAPRQYRFAAGGERRRTSAELELCTDNLGLALEADAARGSPRPVLRLDIMNPCWIYRGADLSAGASLRASVGALPFNFQIGADAAKIRVGDSTTADGELEVRIDGCDTTPVLRIPLAAAASRLGVTSLDGARLPARAGRHDLCLRFARPALDPMWALDWVELGE